MKLIRSSSIPDSSSAYKFAIGFCILLSGQALGQNSASITDPERVIVTGENLVDKVDLTIKQEAQPASVTVLKYSEVAKRNTRDYSDLLRNVTGVAANSFDQGGVGFGIALRGYSERSNGGNVAYAIDGVPINFPGHVSSNGYGDLFPLIAELVDTFVLVRGPFDVRFGSFALGGSLNITTLDHPRSGADVSFGNFDFARGLAVYEFRSGQISAYGSLLGSTQTGYRDNSDFRQFNTFNKFHFPMFGGTGAIRFQIYNSDFGAPTYLDRNLLNSGRLRPTDAVNSTDGGSTAQQNIVFNYREQGDQPLSANLYFVHVNSKRWATRTFTMPIDPSRPGQFLTADYRYVIGGNLEKYFLWKFPNGMGLGFLAGVGSRFDSVSSEQFASIRRNPGAPTADVNFKQTNLFTYAQLDFVPVPWVKLTGGVRYDYFYYDIRDNFRRLYVSPTDSFVGPRAGLSITPVRGLSFFGNYGRGFRPPSAITDLGLDPRLESATNESIEVGLQYNSPTGVWHFLGSVYHTRFTNELQGRPAPLPPIALGPSTRDGFDVEARVRLYQDGGRSFSLFANYSALNGELVNRAGGTSIPDVADFFGTYGLDLVLPLPSKDSPHILTLVAMQRWEGPKPLTTTRNLSTRTYSRVDLRLAYTNTTWRGFSAFVNLVFYPDRRYEETAFVFGNSVGVSPKAPFTVQGGVFVPF